MSDPLLQIAALWSRDRDFLVSHGAERKWHEYPCSCGEAVYLRNVLPNEVVFESDVGGYDAQRPQIVQFLSYLRGLGVEPLVAWSGSKSFHVYVYVDMTQAFDPRAPILADDAPQNIDILNVARKTIWRRFVEASGTKLTFDPSNVGFSVEHKGRMVRWAGSIKPDAKAGTTPFTFLNDGIPETRPASMAFEVPRAIPKLWDVPDWLQGEITRAVLRAQEAEIERRERQVEVTDPMVKVFIEAYGKDWKRFVPMWRKWFEKGVIWPSGTNWRRAMMCVRAMTTLGMTKAEISAELEKLEVHVGYKGYNFGTWTATIDADMKNPLTEIDGDVFRLAESVVESRRLMKIMEARY